MQEQKTIQLLKFLTNKIQTLRQKNNQQIDVMQRLKLAISQVTYAHLLKQYLNNSSYIIQALLHLSSAYIATQNYQQAQIQARIVKKQAVNTDLESKHRATLLIAQCMMKKNRFQDTYDVLKAIKYQQSSLQCKQAYLEILLNSVKQLKYQSETIQTLAKIEELILNKYGNQSIQYGFYLVKQGKSFGRFGKYNQALLNLTKGIEILIQKKCKDIKKITQIYLTMADFYKKQKNLQKQNSSLMCAYSMARQLDEPQKETLPILHMLITNLIEKQQYQKALKQLKKIKQLQKQLYGESSAQIAKTAKKMTEVLKLLNMNSEAKKCEQQYSRIVGSCGINTLKQKSLNISKQQL